VTIVLAGFFAAMAAYNHAVTGTAKQMPYAAHAEQYAACPTFYFQTLEDPPQYRHADIEEFYSRWELERFVRKRNYLGFNSSYATKWRIFVRFFIGPALAIPFAVSLFTSTDFWSRVAWMIVLGLLVAMSQTLYLHTHYVAPITGLVWFLAIQGARRLSVWKFRGLKHRFLAGALLVIGGVGPIINGLGDRNGTTRRSEMIKALKAQPGEDLVLVKFGENHNFHESWIYNSADLDGAPVVWARSLGDAADARLLQHFYGRRVWRLDVDRQRADLSPIGSPATSSTEQTAGSSALTNLR
jgi:hypothetical protein